MKSKKLRVEDGKRKVDRRKMREAPNSKFQGVSWQKKLMVNRITKLHKVKLRTGTPYTIFSIYQKDIRESVAN
ncbi:hypothetical protein [Salinimicrobium xinjiangense]|uniref:hypothetical protein n=1 Tax=Salinimicrobium xinjiangense TaxID=438596 RepID=UPI00048B7C26|nr:hypothetical protein [Salinimicrobium xinjiangense]